jgi:polar amino acid transport system substrate-binding protein
MTRLAAAPYWLAVLALALLCLIPALPAQAQAQPRARFNIVPDAWQGDALRPKPDLKGLDKLRFVTDTDYPPFQYYDEVGVLTGFNVDLAKAICEVLNVQCEIEATNWSDLIPSLRGAQEQ